MYGLCTHYQFEKNSENIITIKLFIKVRVFFLQMIIQLLHKPDVKRLQRKTLERAWVRMLVFFLLHCFVFKYAFSCSANFHCSIQD